MTKRLPPPSGRDRWNTIYFSELGSSAAVLDAGYNIDCLLVRYQGVDWRDKANWDCNARWGGHINARMWRRACACTCMHLHYGFMGDREVGM